MRGKANIFWLTLAALLGMPLGLRSQPGSLDLSFNPNLNDGAAVYALALQPDGKILIGGSFYFIDDQLVINVARLNPDGSLDSTFVPGSAADSGYVSAIAVQNDGKVLIGGSFYSSRGVTPNNLARLNSDGTVATDFHTNSNLTVDGPVNAIVVQSDGKILLGGSFGVVDLPRKDIARLNPDGTLDTNFDACVSAGAGSGATALAVLNSGKILASGDFGFSLGGLRRGGIARLNPNGNLDTSYAGVQPGILPTGSTPLHARRPQ